MQYAHLAPEREPNRPKRQAEYQAHLAHRTQLLRHGQPDDQGSGVESVEKFGPLGERAQGLNTPKEADF